MTYDLEKGTTGSGKNETPALGAGGLAALGLGEGPGGAGDMDGAGEDGAGDEDHGSYVPDTPAMAGTGDGGDTAGAGAAGEPGGRGGPVPADPGAPGQEAAAGGQGEADPAPGAAAGGCPGGETSGRSMIDEPGSEGAPAHRADREGAGGADDGDSGGGDARGLPENLLQVGEEGAAGYAGSRTGRCGGPAIERGAEGNEGSAPQGEDPLGQARGDGGDGRAAAHAPDPGAAGR